MEAHSTATSRGEPPDRDPENQADGGRGEVRLAADDLVSAVEDAAHRTDELLKPYAEERPYALVGVAAGVGFVLGLGLAARLGTTLLTFGGRLFLTRVAEEWVATGRVPSFVGSSAPE